MTTDTATQNDGAPEAAPAVEPPRVRMDKSRSFSTIHGDRPPGDPHHGVMFVQDGIPCDAEGYFLFDHPDMLKKGPEGDKRRKMAEKHIKRAAAMAARAKPKPAPRAADEDFDDQDPNAVDDDEDDDDGLLPPVSLAAWLRGEQQVVWNDVSQEIARTYKRRISKIEDAVAFLVKEGVVPPNEVQKKYQRFV